MSLSLPTKEGSEALCLNFGKAPLLPQGVITIFKFGEWFMMTTSISVIIPCYNHAAWLSQAIESALCSHVQEIIIVNDGSTDDSINVARKYADNETKIKILNIRNGGPARARNQGARIASGEYLIFLDSDDRLQNRALDEVMRSAWLWEGRPDVILCDGEIVEKSGKRVRQLASTMPVEPDRAIKKYLENKVKIMQGSYLIKRERFLELFFPERIRSQEDIPFFLAMLSKCNIRTCPVLLLEYHRWRGAVSRNFIAAWDASFANMDVLFEPPYANAVLDRNRRSIYRKKAASLMRSAYARGRHDMVLEFFRQAVHRDSMIGLSMKLIKRVIRSYLIILFQARVKSAT